MRTEFENRFRDWSLDRVFGSFPDFVDAAQWQQFRALKYEIETMRRRPEIAGYVITEFTDCHWESNGLLDLRRNPRVFHDVFRTINADTIIVPQWDRLAFWDDEMLQVGVRYRSCRRRRRERNARCLYRFTLGQAHLSGRARRGGRS